jgi:hypothetical protein
MIYWLYWIGETNVRIHGEIFRGDIAVLGAIARIVEIGMFKGDFAYCKLYVDDVGLIVIFFS